MSVAEMLRRSPVFQRIKDREDFVTTVAVTLRWWDDLEVASWWCEQHWQDSDRQYRRRLVVENRVATFEFPCIDHAVVFLMKFGASATDC